MFIDMRGSTRLAEARLPFDTVFLINRFLEAASQAVVDGGGQPNQFVGDGLLALFGLHADPATACRQAIQAAAMVASNVEYMNHEFASELPEPIQFGIGIHAGEVIIGDIGFRDHTGVHCARRRGQCRGPPSGHDEGAELHDRGLGGGLQERRHCAGQADENRGVDPRPRSADDRLCGSGPDFAGWPARAEAAALETERAVSAGD